MFEDAICMNGVVGSGEESALVIKFSDGSKHALGENAKIGIDRHVYNPGGESSRAATSTKGAFRFLPGSMSQSQVQIKTPSFMIDIRGTELFCDVSEDGETEVSTLEGQADATDGSGETQTVNPEEPLTAAPDRRFRSRVQRFRHVRRSIVIAEGLGGTSKRWRTRKAKRRRAVRRTDRRRHING